MQVKIEVSPEHTPPRAVIYTDRITPEIQRALDILQAKDTPVLAERDGRTFLLSEQEVYMIRVVGGETKLYTKKEESTTRKRLYEVLPFRADCDSHGDWLRNHVDNRFLVGWIPTDKGLLPALLAVVSMLLTVFVISVFSYRRQKNLAERINRELELRRQ